MNIWEEMEQELREICPALELRQKEPMSKYTTFRVGGPAALMAFPKTEKEAVAAISVARRFGVVPFFLGNGSNLLVSDEGYPGFVIKYTRGIGDLQENHGHLVAGAGVLLPQLANAAWERGFAGLEFASGIPGTVGGAITMNAGAYGGEMSQVVEWVKVVDMEGTVTVVPGEACDFSYRHSVFLDGKHLILEGAFRLQPGDKEAIRARMTELSAQRREKQPLEYPSAGSTFKRPAGYFAAALIDRCGLKGFTVGGAMVSEKHAGFVINKGGATCRDILTLTEEVKKRVYDQTGVTLELEVKTVGV